MITIVLQDMAPRLLELGDPKKEIRGKREIVKKKRRRRNSAKLACSLWTVKSGTEGTIWGEFRLIA